VHRAATAHKIPRLGEARGRPRGAASVHFFLGSGIQYSTACVGLGPRDGSFTTTNRFGMVTANTRIRFPPGVALRLEPHAIVYPNRHFHNYTGAPITTQAVVNLIPARPGSVKHHAQTFTVGSYNINIPAQGSASLTGEWRDASPLRGRTAHRADRGVRSRRQTSCFEGGSPADRPISSAANV
jgi:hypothetical protein